MRERKIFAAMCNFKSRHQHLNVAYVGNSEADFVGDQTPSSYSKRHDPPSHSAHLERVVMNSISNNFHHSGIRSSSNNPCVYGPTST